MNEGNSGERRGLVRRFTRAISLWKMGNFVGVKINLETTKIQVNESIWAEL